MFLRFGRLIALVATLFLIGALGGCAESTQPIATGKGDIRGINAIVTAPEMGFFIEERNLGSMNYKQASGFNKFDDLTFNFNFDMFLPGDAEATRVATHSLDVVADQLHTVILTGTVANPITLDWADPIRSWDDSDTVTEVTFAHLAPGVGDIDVYFVLTGMPPMAGEEIGSLSNGERLAPVDFESDEYDLILTAAGDPTTILFQSIPLATAPRTRVTIAVFESDPSITTAMAVNLINQAGLSSAIPEVNVHGQLRVLHGSFDIENFDGYLNDNLNDVVYPDIGFQELSAYTDLNRFSTNITLTPVGNSGTTIHEGEVNVNRTSKRTVILGGTLAVPFFFLTTDEGRPLETFPVIRIINLAINMNLVNVYIQDPGTSLDDVILPTIPILATGGDSGFFGIAERPQELTITAVGDTTPIAAPIDLDLATGEVADIIILDTVDPDVLEVVIFDRL